MRREPVPPQGVLDDGRHLFPIRVYFEDTDFTGVVYHANYLRFIERARTEMLRELGFHQGAIHAGESGDALFFVVARMQLEFLKPARMDDLLTVETRPLKITAATIELEQIVRREADHLFSAKVLVAALAEGKPRRLPREFREKLELKRS
jgi:acyl-CoA thioester hydrolase